MISLLLTASVLVRVHYPVDMGEAPTLRGSAPLSWDQDLPLESAGDGVFAVRLDDPPAEIKALLNGRWAVGANVAVKREGIQDLYPRFDRHQGRIVVFAQRFASQLLRNERTVWAYLPPSYEENLLARYPVVYMQDGQNLFDGGWEVATTLDRLYEGPNPPREAIVIGVAHAGAERIREYGDRTALYLRFLQEELKPRVDRSLRTLPGASDTGIIGSSMGGLVAASGACTQPEAWGFAGIFSPSVWWNDRAILAAVPALSRADSRPARIYVDSGEDGKADTFDLARAFEAAGYRRADQFRYVYAAGGQHNEAAWARRFPEGVRFLLGPRDEL